MRTFIYKPLIAVLTLFLLVSAIETRGQMNVSWTDHVTNPAPSSSDFYEISWIVFTINPFTTYTCSNSANTAAWNVTSQPEYFTCNLPVDAVIYRVQVAVKRRDGNYTVVAGGNNVTGYMDPKQIAGTFNIHVDLY
jgi:hypothetical protein